MKHLMITGPVILLFIFMMVLQGSAVAKITSPADDAMTVGGGARPIGMGKAFTAVADDADAPFINPAGIAGLKGPQVMTMFTNLIGEIYYMEYCGAVPTQYGTVGMGYISTGVSNIPTTPVPTDYYDSLLLFTYSTPLGRFADYGKNVFLGANYKIYNRGYTGGLTDTASGFSADVGLKVILSPYISLGLSRQNILPVSMGGVIKLNGGAEENLAGLTKLGISIRPAFMKRSLLLVGDADVPAQTGRPVTLHMGAEWKFNENIMFRCGLDQSLDPATATQTSWNPSFGTSFGLGGFRVDYAYHAYYNDSSLATNYVSLSYEGKPWNAIKGEVD